MNAPSELHCIYNFGRTDILGHSTLLHEHSIFVYLFRSLFQVLHSFCCYHTWGLFFYHILKLVVMAIRNTYGACTLSLH